MDDAERRRARARVALSLVEGVARGDEAAEDLLVDAFDGLGDAAAAHAYLAGFVLQALADARGEPLARTCSYVRALLAEGRPRRSPYQ